jgi:hypothetical protein
MKNSPLVSFERFLEKVTPDFDEVTVFLISFAFTVLIIFDHNMRVDTISGLVNPFSLIMFFFLLMAKILAWYHAFSSAKKSHFEKNVLLIFGLIMPVGIGFEAFNNILNTNESYGLLMLIFPIMNILYAALLLFLYRTTSIIHSFDPRNAERYEIYLGMGVILSLVLFLEFVLNAHWSLAYSISIVYATFLGRLPYLFYKFINRKSKKHIVKS